MLDWMREELVEARLLRTVWGVNNRTADQLARMMYLSLLALEILKYENPDAAREYAQRTLQLGGYKRFSPSGTDLYNLMVILSNQEQYEDLIKTNYDVSPGLAEVTGYLRRAWSGSYNNLQDRFILINLTNLLKVDDYSIARRVISFWDNASVSDRRWALNSLRGYMRSLSPALDIFSLLNDL